MILLCSQVTNHYAKAIRIQNIYLDHTEIKKRVITICVVQVSHYKDWFTLLSESKVSEVNSKTNFSPHVSR